MVSMDLPMGSPDSMVEAPPVFAALRGVLGESGNGISVLGISTTVAIVLGRRRTAESGLVVGRSSGASSSLVFVLVFDLL